MLLAAVLLVTFAGCGSADRVGSAAENTIVPTPDGENLRTNPDWTGSECGTRDDITAVVQRFVDAFNDGDQKSLDALFPNESANLQKGTGPAMTTNLDQFQVYSVVGTGEADFIAHSKAEVLDYLTERHEQGEHLQLTIVDVFPYSSGGGVEFQSTRAADDLPERAAFGRVWVSCEQEWVVAFAMGDAPS